MKRAAGCLGRLLSAEEEQGVQWLIQERTPDQLKMDYTFGPPGGERVDRGSHRFAHADAHRGQVSQRLEIYAAEAF